MCGLAHTSRRLLLRLSFMVVSLTLLSSVASAYYHWVYFPGRSGPFNPIRAKFDLSAQPDSHTVSYFVSDQGPSPMMPGDSFQALVSQIKLAAEQWNNVATSTLRLGFGGISSAATQQSAPGIDIVFDDNVVPGLFAYTVVTRPADTSFVANGAPFVPILRSTMHLWKDLTVNQQASYHDDFFLTIVHEFGHTLGLQHTLTSGVMSTQLTRGTTKANPLSPDDIAGLSLLYPTQVFLANTGSISGTVQLRGSGVNLASVVALSVTGGAISSLTNPDGSYRIDGIPPGQYYLYVHPLPPALLGEAYPDNVQPPEDPSQNPFNANIGFATQFFPDTQDWTQATVIPIVAGGIVTAANFLNLQPTSGAAVFGGELIAYQGSGLALVPVQSPYLQQRTRNPVGFFAFGAVGSNNQLAPGLNASVIGGSAQVEAGSLRYWTGGFLSMALDTSAVAVPTPTALAVTVTNDLYVLPGAFTVAPSPPPTISSVTSLVDSQGNATALINGSNLGSGTRILFDGTVADTMNVDPSGTLMLVSAPPGAFGQHASVEALSGDGQTSWQALGSNPPPVFNYASFGAPSIGVSPAALTAGTDVMVTITGFNTNFSSRTKVGFGSSDIAIRQIWVQSPSRLLVNVSVSGAAPPTQTSVTVLTGEQMATQAFALQVQPASPNQVSLRAPIVSQATQLSGVPLGGIAVINTTGLPADLAGWSLLIGGQQTNFAPIGGGQILALVPGGILIGPTMVQLVSPGGASAPAVAMQVDPPAPAIVAAVDAAGAGIDASHAVKTGDAVTLTVAGLGDSLNMLPAASSVQISVAGMNQAALFVAPASGQAGAGLVQFVVPSGVPDGTQIPVMVMLGTRVTAAYFIAVQN